MNTAPHYIPPTKTPVTPNQVYNAFREACPGLTSEGLLVLTAHWALETDAGRRMFNFNIGGLKAKIGGTSDWTFLTTHEVFNGVRQKFPAPPQELQPQLTQAALGTLDASMRKRALVTCFAAHDNLGEAIQRHVKLVSQGRHSEAWQHVEAGDARMYGLSLGGSGYYTADAKAYAAALVRHAATFRAQLPGWKADA